MLFTPQTQILVFVTLKIVMDIGRDASAPERDTCCDGDQVLSLSKAVKARAKCWSIMGATLLGGI